MKKQVIARNNKTGMFFQAGKHFTASAYDATVLDETTAAFVRATYDCTHVEFLEIQ